MRAPVKECNDPNTGQPLPASHLQDSQSFLSKCSRTSFLHGTEFGDSSRQPRAENRTRPVSAQEAARKTALPLRRETTALLRRRGGLLEVRTRIAVRCSSASGIAR